MAWLKYSFNKKNIVKETEKAYFVNIDEVEFHNHTYCGSGVWIAKKLVKLNCKTNMFEAVVGDDFKIKPYIYELDKRNGYHDLDISDVVVKELTAKEFVKKMELLLENQAIEVKMVKDKEFEDLISKKCKSLFNKRKKFEKEKETLSEAEKNKILESFEKKAKEIEILRDEREKNLQDIRDLQEKLGA